MLQETWRRRQLINEGFQSVIMAGSVAAGRHGAGAVELKSRSTGRIERIPGGGSIL